MASLDEFKKFVHSYPEGQREYRTIEIHHPDFTSTLRYVRGFADIDFTLESTAPRDASTSVTFSRAGLQVIEPSESGEVEQILTVNLGAVGGEVNTRLAEITTANSLTPVELIYRKYYSGDLTEPVLILSLAVADVNFKGYERVSFTAEDTNFAIKRAGQLYTTERFPGLKNL